MLHVDIFEKKKKTILTLSLTKLTQNAEGIAQNF